MPIVALLQKAAFDPETIHILTTAFDKAWDKFKSSGSALAGPDCDIGARHDSFALGIELGRASTSRVGRA
jgi:hypothetical protein